MIFSTNHIDYLERTALDEQSYVDSIWEQLIDINSFYNSFHLFHVISIPKTFSDIEIEKFTKLDTTPIEDLLVGVHGLGCCLVYAIVGTSNQVQLYIGLGRRHLDTEKSLLPTLLNSIYPGIGLKYLSPELSWQNLFNDLTMGALITGTPTLKKRSNQDREGQIDRLIRGLYGSDWAYVVFAKPMRQLMSNKFSSLILNELRLIVNSEQSAKKNSPITDKYKFLLNRLWNKSQTGKAQGMWNSVGYLLTKDRSTLSRAKGLAKGIFSGSASLPDPIRLLDTDGLDQKVADVSFPTSPSQSSPGQIQYPYQYLSTLNSLELLAMMHLPAREVAGFFICPQPRFDVTPCQIENSSPAIQIGDIVNQGQITGTTYNLNLDTLTRHTMVVGTTGSGKTNTIFHLLNQFFACQIPFLIIEPAKTEYRTLLETNLGSNLKVFTLGNETVSPFRLNPFQILPDVSVQTHIDHLKSVFNASFAMYAPMPYVLEQCIHEIYEDKGWDLISSENRRGVHPQSYPTLTDLYHKIDEVVNKLGYEQKITMNIKAALKTRINNLRVGGKGLMLDTLISLPIENLLQQPTILELETVGDDEEKAFLIGLVLMFLYEYYSSTGYAENEKLKHITVIEEAHRLLKKSPPTADLETANMAGKAVETFSNILAEIRAYGEGIIVAEQIPLKLTPDVIKNTNLKIIHRTVSEDDRKLIGGSMSFKPEQLEWVGICQEGEAVVFSGKDDGSIRVKIPYEKIKTIFNKNQSNQNVHTLMEPFRSNDSTIKSSCFNIFPWSPVNFNILNKYRSQARPIVENLDFQEVFAKYVISSVIISEALLQELTNVIQVINKYSYQQSDKEFWNTIFTFAVDWLFETRGRQTGANYYDIETLKRQFIQILFENVFPKYFSSDIRNKIFSNETVERIENFQSTFKRVFQCETYPFAGCDLACPEKTCLYRYNAALLAEQGTLQRRFVKALENSNSNSIWEKAAKVASIAARRIVTDSVSIEEKRKVSLCFAIQATETIDTIDNYLKETVVTQLLNLSQTK